LATNSAARGKAPAAAVPAVIAWVAVDPGYGPNPGHPGTGTVMSIDNCAPGGDSGGGGGPVNT
jgi:hypothetical protein